MNRGTIVEIGEGSAILLTPEGEFVRVKAGEDAEIGREVEWSVSDRLPVRTARAARTRRRFAAGAFAAVLLMLVAALWSFRPPTVVAYVSMDINPSMEMGLDAKERVRELNALNPDAEAITRGIAYKGKPVEEVMRILAQKLADAKLLNPGDGEIIIASVRLHTVDEDWESHVIEKMESVLRQAGTDEAAGNGNALTIETVYLPAEVREEAQEQGISSGKMAVWLAAESEGYEVELDDLKKKSVEAVASSLGGVKKVLEDSRIDKDDKTAWKEMLAEQKKAEKENQEAVKEKKKEEKNRDKQQDKQRDKQEKEKNKQEKQGWKSSRKDQSKNDPDAEDDKQKWGPGEDKSDPGNPLVRKDERNRDKDDDDDRSSDKGRNDGQDKNKDKDKKKDKDEDRDRRDQNGKENNRRSDDRRS